MQRLFNRAVRHTLSRAKLLFVFVVLALCGLLVVFFRTLSLHAGRWMAMSLAFLPIFLCAGVLLATGIVLTRIYHDEVKQRSVSLWNTLSRSWELMAGATYIAIPIVLTYLLLWMILGLFYLLQEIPLLGGSLSVLLAFGPFLLNLGSLLLCVLTVGVLFFVTPAVAFMGMGRRLLSDAVWQRLQLDPYSNLCMFTMALLPTALIAALLTFAALLTSNALASIDHSLHVALEWFFIMIPFTALLAPAVVFFFNFAAEAHAHMRKELRLSVSSGGSNA